MPSNFHLRLRCLLACGLLAPLAAFAQNPKLAEKDLAYTKRLIAPNHLVERVTLETDKNQSARYQYDRYSDVVRIRTADGATFARPAGKGWLRSSDWGKTGSPLKADQAAQMDGYARVAEAPFDKPQYRDASQGAGVWRFVERAKQNDGERFTYERSRERPNPGSAYPRFTFVKFQGDEDGELLLSHFGGPLRGGETSLYVSIDFDVLIALPANTVSKVAPPKKGR